MPVALKLIPEFLNSEQATPWLLFQNSLVKIKGGPHLTVWTYVRPPGAQDRSLAVLSKP